MTAEQEAGSWSGGVNTGELAEMSKGQALSGSAIEIKGRNRSRPMSLNGRQIITG